MIENNTYHSTSFLGQIRKNLMSFFRFPVAKAQQAKASQDIFCCNDNKIAKTYPATEVIHPKNTLKRKSSHNLTLSKRPRRVFEDNEKNYHTWVEDLGPRQLDKTGQPKILGALQNWAAQILLSHKKITNNESLTIALLPVKGCRNYGIYNVKDINSQQEFIIKRSNRPYEPILLDSLQFERGNYPYELTTGPFANNAERSPLIIPMLDWEYFHRRDPWGDSENGEPIDWEPLILFEKAIGCPIILPDQHTTADELNDQLQSAYHIGFSLALLHLPFLEDSATPIFEQESWYHGDLNANNCFYNAKHKRLELIDCIDMKKKANWQLDLCTILEIDSIRDVCPFETELDQRQKWRHAFITGYMEQCPDFARTQLKQFFCSLT